MTYQNDCTLPNELMVQIAEQGLDYLPELIRVVVNAAMKGEVVRQPGTDRVCLS